MSTRCGVLALLIYKAIALLVVLTHLRRQYGCQLLLICQ